MPEQTPAATAYDELLRIRREMSGVFNRAAERVARGELAFIGWGLTRARVQILQREHVERPWFFIGDLHGDFLAWATLFARVRKEPDFRLCFLGDLIDRGPLAIECFAALLEAADQYPQQILWILGNHDQGLAFNAAHGAFSSSVEPAEFAEWLNTGPLSNEPLAVRRWGRLFIDICRRLPRAVLFPDRLLATHGGIPLQDRWDSLVTLEAFHDTRSLEDFTWTRASSAASKLGWKYTPDRRAYSSSFEFGYKDLAAFCAAVADIFPVERVVRGHDHVEGGFEQPAMYSAVPILTLNGFGFHYLSNSVRNYRETLLLGVARQGKLPEIEPVPYAHEDHRLIYSPGEEAAP